MQIIPSRESFAQVRWWTVPAYLGTLLATHFFRASRWRYLIRPVKDDIPFWDGVLLNWIGFFAIFALPLRLGEMARPTLTKLRHGVSVSAGLGTVAVERVIDGLVTSLCVVWALVALPQLETDDEIARRLPYYGYLAVSVFCAAFVALALFLWQRVLAVRLVHGTVGRISKRFGELIATKVASVADGVRSMADPKLASGFLFETLLYWGLNAAGMWLLGWGAGLDDMTFGHAVAVMGILAIGILLPAGPGLFGNFQLAVATALKLYFAVSVVGAQGEAYIFLMFVAQAVLITAAGVIPLNAMKFTLGDLLRSPAERAED
ncbi:MAG: lysylphosphatidylglycerol synthase transmembrane domain-containing protein [Myxococcota bacterium]|nr:lysylphosphatidylglycerol synthase transmembrane domain-containing protein [Myxococcota bacterium]